MAGYDNSLFANVRQNTDRMYGRRRRLPDEIAEENRIAAQAARSDELGLRRQIAQQSSMDARAAQEGQQRYGMARDEAQGRRAERLGYINQGIVPPSEAATKKPSGPDPTDVANNLRYQMKQRGEIGKKLKTGWRPSITYGGETAYADNNGSVQATPGMMRTGEMAAQASQLADVQQSNIRGMDAMKRAIGGYAPAARDVANRVGAGQSTDQARAARMEGSATAEPSTDSNAVVMGTMRNSMDRTFDRLAPDLELEQQLSEAQAANQLIEPNQAALDERIASRGPELRQAVQQGMATPDDRVRQWQTDNPLAVEAGMPPPEYLNQAPMAQAQPGPEGFDNTALMARNQELIGSLQQRLAALEAQQVKPQAGPAMIPGGTADRNERTLKLREAESGRADRAMNTTLQAQPLPPYVSQAIASIPTNTPEATVAGVSNALLLGQTPEEKLKIAIEVRDMPWYKTAPDATRMAIEKAINPQAVQAPAVAPPAEPEYTPDQAGYWARKAVRPMPAPKTENGRSRRYGMGYGQ